MGGAFRAARAWGLNGWLLVRSFTAGSCCSAWPRRRFRRKWRQHPTSPPAVRRRSGFFASAAGLRPQAQTGSLTSASRMRAQVSPNATTSASPASAAWQPLGHRVVTANYGLVTGRVSSLALDPSDATGTAFRGDHGRRSVAGTECGDFESGEHRLRSPDRQPGRSSRRSRIPPSASEPFPCSLAARA